MAENTNMSTPMAIVIAGALIALAVVFTSSGLMDKLLGTEKPSVAGVNTPSVVGQGNNTQPTEPTGPIAVEVDDDPVLGDPNAPITIIEFSDYECPYCQRSYREVLSQVKAEYIDTGIAKLVFRDLPLYFHDPMATNAALAANCARAQGGDSKYFEYHDEYFERTLTNGATPEATITEVAADVGLNISQFNSCYNNQEYLAEVQADLAYASTVGATGTPTYFVGKSTDTGTIEAGIIQGAQPFSSFKTVIESYLNQ